MTTLYRYYDEQDLLLYVGIAANPVVRQEAHHGTTWWKSARRATFEHFPSRAAALEAERKAIQTERPLFNRMHAKSDAMVTADPGRRYTVHDVVQEFREAISTGRLHVGNTLPPQRELSEILGAPLSVIRSAMATLRRERLIHSWPGRKTMIRAGAPFAEEVNNPGIRAVTRNLRAQIDSGDLGTGTKLPSAQDIAEKFGASLPEAVTALKILQSDRLITVSPIGEMYVRGAD